MVLKITVKTLDSQNYQFEAEDEWTVKRFKEHIQDTVNVPHNEQRLIFCGRVLQDDKRLTEYDCNEKVMHLVRRPPPSLENPERDSTATQENSDTNNNDSSFPGEIRFDLDDNFLFSAMTLGTGEMGHLIGSEVTGPNQMLRHIMTLQQELYSRIIGEPANLAPSNLDNGMGDIGRRLHNASRLSRMIDSLLNECTSRLSRNQARQTRSRNSASTSVSTSREPINDTLFEPTQVLSAARSHNELQTNDYMQTSETETSTNTAFAESSPSDNLAASRSSETSTSYTARRQPRPALTTDDLPQNNSRLSRPFAPAIDPRPRNDNVPSAARQESQLDQYMTLLDHSNDIIDRTRNLVRRYRELVTISRNGGFILPTQTQAPDSQQQRQSSSSSSTEVSNQSPISSALVLEARNLNHYIPRILHHSSHLQHALSDFSVDFARGRLRVISHRQQQQHAHQPTSSVNAPMGRVRIGHSRGQSNDRAQIEVPLDVTITATTIETQPMSTVTSSRPQTSATIVVSTDPGQPGIHIPVSIPLAVNTRDGSASARPSHMNNEQRDSPRSPSPEGSNQNNQQQQQQPPTPQTTRENTSTQTAPRPIGVISGRIPLPFDYYLSCFSPHAHYSPPPQTARSLNHPSTRIRAQTSRPQENSPGATYRAAHPSVQVRTGSIPLTTQPLDAAMTEVVNNIIGSIFRPPTSQPTTQASSTTQSASGLNSAPNPAQDQIFNMMIPELAINAASQVLGGLFGHVGAGPTVQQPQANRQQRTGQQQQPQQTSSSGHVMMDIDIDDSSSSQSGSRYQDARETVPRAETQASSSRQPPIMAQPNVSVSTPITYSREQLLDIARAHADWIPIIESDISFMEQQNRTVANSPPYFSDAYLSSVPRKRRRLLTATPDRVLILHPSPFHAINNVLRRALTNSNLPTEFYDQVLTSIANDPELQSAYDEHIRSAVEARLRTDYDYEPEKFENSRKYFK